MLFARSWSVTRRRPVGLPFASYCTGNRRRTSARIWYIVKVAVGEPAPQQDAKGPVSSNLFAFTTCKSRPRNFAPTSCEGSETIVSQYSHAPRISAGEIGRAHV